ncbi:MAG TPA: cyclic nucleotide-binding domain-containing protein [Vicinamibacterales bacterium]|nr:cyclic nucleotide-binding domain-containing protein [Vicinamibacterales bacterium]
MAQIAPVRVFRASDRPSSRNDSGLSRSAATPPRDGAWVARVRAAALVVFLSLIGFSLVDRSHAGRVFWTVAVASLPLIVVLAGYHRWRRICPLGLLAQLPARFGVGGRRRAGGWMQRNAYYLSLAAFLVSLWLRLVGTNGDGYAIAAFLVVISAAAIAVDAAFTGKTWCNYVCPVLFVEKLYTEPRGLRETPNSQCDTCTACRPSCPDINEENSFWKEILLPAKRSVYFAFPGIVLGFYGYYFLQAGTWAYYFGGTWTNQPGLFRTAFVPGTSAATAGFYFLPALPRAAAAAATLLAAGLISLVVFRSLEVPLGRLLARPGEDVDAAAARSGAFAVAAFAAFVGFYSFAGAPTLRLVPGLWPVFQVIVVSVGTLGLVRRVWRRKSTFAEETLARRVIANWPWPDVAPPRDLREAFLIHTIRSESHGDARRRLRDLYKSAVRDIVESGIASRTEVHRLASLRQQLHVSDADHELVMAELADEAGGLAAGPPCGTSPEKQLQLGTYAEALAVHLEQQRSSTVADDAFVRELRKRYGVTTDEHLLVVDRLLRERQGIAGQLHESAGAIEWLAAAAQHFETATSPAARFFLRLVKRRWHRLADGLVQTLAGEGPAVDALRNGLLAPSAAIRDEVIAVVASMVSPATAASLRASADRARAALGTPADPALLLEKQFASPDPYLRATALYLLASLERASESHFERCLNDEHPVVRDLAVAARAVAAGESGVAASVLEKMIALQSVGLFEGIEPEDLALLSHASIEVWFTEGECLCRESERGDEIFVVLDGEVTVTARGRPPVVEGRGSCVGELAVLDPAPRESTVVASTIAVRALRLTGPAFRGALASSPVVSEAVIRILVRRLRRAHDGF